VINKTAFKMKVRAHQIIVIISTVKLRARSYSMLSKNIKIKIYKSITLYVFCMGVKRGSYVARRTQSDVS
jgi:hypothetical protein